ncbi:MAG: sulfite exporter TauE/SafE family protein [Bacteroidales bacterium]|jgi:uncharacterized membrane protein YfcA|nr:sulfite exporter TauE/SafE family protein [Bacteroidales bacterium]
MDINIVIVLILSGLIVGFINTLAGGGTIISMTVFMSLGLPPLVANGTNRIAIFLQTLTAVINYQRNKILDIRKSLKFALPVILGSIIGSNLAISIDERIFNYFLVGILLFMTGLIIFKPKLWLTDNPDKIVRPMSILQWIIYFIIGIYGGFIHVGIGYFLIAAIVLMGGYNLLNANAIKNLIVFLYIPVSLIPFIINSQVRYDYGLIHAIGNVIGAYLASQWASKFGSKFIRYILIFLLLISCFQIFRIFKITDIILTLLK